MSAEQQERERLAEWLEEFSGEFHLEISKFAFDNLHRIAALLRRTPEAQQERRIEGWAQRTATMEEQYVVRSAASFYGRDPSSRGFSDRATLIIHERPSTGEGES